MVQMKKMKCISKKNIAKQINSSCSQNKKLPELVKLDKQQYTKKIIDARTIRSFASIFLMNDV